jgi:serine kinase of HPr protein (carbohydrate metabolism regulator)
MKVIDIIKKFDLEVYSGKEGVNRDVTGGYASDLLSDVMGNSREGDIWVTLQTHKNVIAVASLRDIAAIVCVRGLKPDNDTLEASEKEGIPVLGTCENTFEMSGKLFNFISSEK